MVFTIFITDKLQYINDESIVTCSLVNIYIVLINWVTPPSYSENNHQ